MDLVAWVLGGLGGVAALKAFKGSGEGGAGVSFGKDPTSLRAGHGILTPGRKDIFERAMRSKGTPDQFRKLAAGFESQGLREHARLLRARANARAATPELHAKRREVIRKAFQSRDPMHAERIAQVAENELGMTVSAEKLREHAKGLRDAQSLAGGFGNDLLPEGFVMPPDLGPSIHDSHEHVREPYVAQPGLDPAHVIKGDGGNMGSVTQMAGDAMSGDCVFHTTSGDCGLEQKDKITPPPMEDEGIAAVETANPFEEIGRQLDQERPFERAGGSSSGA